MADHPAKAYSQKQDSSIAVGYRMLKKGLLGGFCSAGNTGAMLVGASYTVNVVPGVFRPALATILPCVDGRNSVILDVGLNPDCKPDVLLQYGILGTIYAKFVLEIENPTIGLLNIGEEETKGTDFVKETHKLLNESRLNFIGNVEGRDIYTGECDVIICDGFLGNVVLKVSESVAFTMVEFLKRELKRSVLTKLSVLFARSAFRNFKQKIDYAEYGGAPLLGVDGAVIISHGSSSKKAIKNAIRVAVEFKEKTVNEHIMEEIERWKG